MRTRSAVDTKPQRRIASEEEPASRRLWIVEIDHTHAHIYERTGSGTRWIGDACMDQDLFHLHTHGRDPIPTHPGPPLRPALPQDHLHFLSSFAKWLDFVERSQAFDKAVLVATTVTIIDLQPALSKRLSRCVKLAPDETLAINAVEDRLAAFMWH